MTTFLQSLVAGIFVIGSWFTPHQIPQLAGAFPNPGGGGSGSGSGSSTIVTGTNGVSVTQVGSNATASLDTTYSASWTGSETFNATATFNSSTIHTSAITVNPDGTATDTYKFFGRLNVNIPVPYLTPATNTAIAFDVFPHGASGTILNGFGNSIYGAAWEDICDSDIAADGTNYECLHLAKAVNGNANVSASQGGTGVVRNLILQAFGGNTAVGTILTTPTSTLTVNGTFTVQNTSTFYGKLGVNKGIPSATVDLNSVTAVNVASRDLAVGNSVSSSSVPFVVSHRVGSTNGAYSTFGVNAEVTTGAVGLVNASSDGWMFEYNGLNNATGSSFVIDRLAAGAGVNTQTQVAAFNYAGGMSISGNTMVGSSTISTKSLTVNDITNNSSTLAIGGAGRNSCLELTDVSSSSLPLVYFYASSTAGVPFVTSTYTKPGWCQ